jgi:hypothetical protein
MDFIFCKEFNILLYIYIYIYNASCELQHIQIWTKNFNIIKFFKEKSHQTSMFVSHLPGTVQREQIGSN